MPTAIVSTATIENPGFFHSARMPLLISDMGDRSDQAREMPSKFPQTIRDRDGPTARWRNGGFPDPGIYVALIVAMRSSTWATMRSQRGR
jgi:hypothetical protein